MLKITILLATLIFSALLAHIPAVAASFNCAKATTQTEKMICADQDLGKLDEQLAGIYSEGKHIPGLKNEQRAWLTEIKKCIDVACLKTAYRERLEELNTQIISFGRSEARELDNSSKIRKPGQQQKTSEEIKDIGICIAMNALHQEQKGTLPTANQTYQKKHTKLIESFADGYSKIKPCIQQGGSQEQCANQLPPVQRDLVLGVSNGTFLYNKAKKNNDTAAITVMMFPCGIYQ